MGRSSNFFEWGSEFTTMADRMSSVRGAALRGELGPLPLTTLPHDEEEMSLATLPREGYIRWWSAEVIRGRPLFTTRMMMDMGGSYKGARMIENKRTTVFVKMVWIPRWRQAQFAANQGGPSLSAPPLS